MSYIKNILKQATIKSIMNYLLHEGDYPKDIHTDYQLRLKSIRKYCTESLTEYGINEDSAAHDVINELVSEYQDVYTQIGALSILLLGVDALRQSGLQHLMQDESDSVNEKPPFKDILFSILNENDLHFKDLELDDNSDTLLITGKDNSKHLLSLWEVSK